MTLPVASSMPPGHFGAASLQPVARTAIHLNHYQNAADFLAGRFHSLCFREFFREMGFVEGGVFFLTQADYSALDIGGHFP